MIEEALRDPVSVGMLKIDGARAMSVTGMPPGPKIGYILHALLEEVLDDPSKNTATYLEERTIEISKMPEQEIKKLGEAGKETKEKQEKQEIKKLRSKHHVQ